MSAPPSSWTCTRARALVASAVAACVACGRPTEPAERVRTYDVAESITSCNSIGGYSQCLRVRVPPDTAERLVPNAIEGFTFEAGYRWRLVVAERDVRNPPPDMPSTAWRLVRVVSKTPAAGGTSAAGTAPARRVRAGA